MNSTDASASDPGRFRRAAVIGTGMMGPGIAAILAMGGVETTILSRTEEAAREGVTKAQALANVLAVEALAGPDCAPISASSDWTAATKDCDLVIESAPEDMPFKQDLFARLETGVRPDTVLASNTSGLSITEIASKCSHPGRVLTTHFWNPPHLMPLVEIVKGKKTSDSVAQEIRTLLLHCRKVPVIIQKDTPGQLGNRLQMALVREAIHILESGIADVENIDLAVKNGFGLRLPVYGVFEHADMVGLDMMGAIFDYVSRDLSNQQGMTDAMKQRVSDGQFGVKSGQGFYDWSKKDAKQVRALRDEFVLDVMKRYRKQGR